MNWVKENRKGSRGESDGGSLRDDGTARPNLNESVEEEEGQQVTE